MNERENGERAWFSNDPTTGDRLYQDAWRVAQGRHEDATARLEQAKAEAAALFHSAADLVDAAPVEVDWLIPNMLPRGWALKISAREKCGKGQFTLVEIIGALENKRATCFGPAHPRSVSAVMCIEEPRDSLVEKLRDAGIRKSECVFTHELAHLTPEAKAALLVQRAVEGGHEIVFIDNLSDFYGVTDEAGPELAVKVAPLINLCKTHDKTFITNHHHRKGNSTVHDASRGSTALPAKFDNNVELFLIGNNVEDRRRRIHSKGRLSATLWDRKIELADDRRSYIMLDEGVKEHDTPEDDQKLTLLREHGPITVKAFSELLSLDRSAVSRWLSDYKHAYKTGEKDGRADLWDYYDEDPYDGPEY